MNSSGEDENKIIDHKCICMYVPTDVADWEIKAEFYN